MNKIKAILFDSGRVLNGPVTGNWFITPNFFKFVDKKKYNLITGRKKRKAFEKANEYINNQKLIKNEDEEYKHFIEYYRIFSECLPELQLSESDVQAIAEDLVYNYDKYKFYDDAIELIPELSKEYKLAVVSDAWPSLENVFKKAGMRKYFSSFVISSVKGVTKPDKLMYNTALLELNVLPEDSIYIDDSIKNCNGAAELGINSLLLCRDKRLYIYNKLILRHHNVISGLNEVKRFLI